MYTTYIYVHKGRMRSAECTTLNCALSLSLRNRNHVLRIRAHAGGIFATLACVYCAHRECAWAHVTMTTTIHGGKLDASPRRPPTLPAPRQRRRRRCVSQRTLHYDDARFGDVNRGIRTDFLEHRCDLCSHFQDE